MWSKDWRQQAWQTLDQQWDILVIGGGITGTGILRRAVHDGYKTLLVEAEDFGSGTSSKSSKMIHGGFRYLRNKQVDVTRESVREREWLLKEAPDLVTPLGFLMPCPENQKIARQYGIGVVLYDLLAPKWQHQKLSRRQLLQYCPQLMADNLRGGYLYYDAVMDDSRLVLRLIFEAVSAGGTALNYTKATPLIRDAHGQVCGAILTDHSPALLGEKEVKARVVINATGPWSDELRGGLGAPARLRKLRGSHLVFSRERLDLKQAVTLLHPRDHRSMFALPWEGVTLVGTTDLDHAFSLVEEPFTTDEEIEYILEAARATFPHVNLGREDILSTFAGLRPVVNTGIADPSKESRAHVVWEESGMITITGGKYTTFRIMAEQTLQHAAKYLAQPAHLAGRSRYFNLLPRTSPSAGITAAQYAYLAGRYGLETDQMLDCAEDGENSPVHHLPNFWSELRWSARCSAVEHLDDLLLRRVRLGILLPDAARADMEKIRRIVQPELSWSEQRWQQEVTRYLDIYRKAYSPAPAGF